MMIRSIVVRVLGPLASVVAFATVSSAQRATPLPGHVVDIRVGEYFIHAPDSIPSGLVTLRLTQTGDATKPWPADTARLRADMTYHLHMVWVVRLDSAKTVSDLFAAERDGVPTPWATMLGGPGFADAPAASNVTMVLSPGSYALVCYVGSAREDRGRYHLLKGMIRPLTVLAAASADPLPAAELTIVFRGGAVLMPDTLAAREWRIMVRNDGDRVGDFGIAKVRQGYTLDQARAWQPRFLTESPRQVIGGVIYMAPQTSLMTTVTLEAGQYLFRGKHVVVR